MKIDAMKQMIDDILFGIKRNGSVTLTKVHVDNLKAIADTLDDTDSLLKLLDALGKRSKTE